MSQSFDDVDRISQSSLRQIQIAFLQFFVSIFSKFKEFLTTTQFDKEKYLESRGPDGREFLSEFVETQAFSTLVFNFMTTNTRPFLFDCLINGTLSFPDLQISPPPPFIRFDLPSPFLMSSSLSSPPPLTWTIDCVRMEELAMKKQKSSELFTLVDQQIATHPVLQLYLFRASLHLRNMHFFEALKDFAEFYHRDVEREYPKMDFDFFQCLFRHLTDHEIEYISKMEGPVAKFAKSLLFHSIRESQKVVTREESFEVEKQGTESDDHTLFAEPFALLQVVTLSSKMYMSREVFRSFSFQIGLVRDETQGDVLYEALTVSQKKSSQTKGLRNSILLNLTEFIAMTWKKESKENAQKLKIPESEHVLLSFGHVFDQQGMNGELFLTSKRIVFKPFRSVPNKRAFLSHFWTKVEEVERYDGTYLIGGLPCVRVKMETNAKQIKKCHEYRFWTKDQRESCFLHMTELRVAFIITREVLIALILCHIRS